MRRAPRRSEAPRSAAACCPDTGTRSFSARKPRAATGEQLGGRRDQAGKNSIGLVVVIVATSRSSNRNIFTRATSLRSSSAISQFTGNHATFGHFARRCDGDLEHHLALQRGIFTQRPAVQRVDGRFVLVKDQFDLFTRARCFGALAGPLGLGCCTGFGRRGRNLRRGVTLQTGRTAAEALADLAHRDATTARPCLGRKNRAINAGAFSGSGIQGPGVDARLDVEVTQLGQLIRHGEQSRGRRFLARIGFRLGLHDGHRHRTFDPGLDLRHLDGLGRRHFDRFGQRLRLRLLEDEFDDALRHGRRHRRRARLVRQ